MNSDREHMAAALTQFCQSGECTSFNGAVRPDTAMHAVNALVAAASKRVPAYAKCCYTEGKEPVPGEHHMFYAP
jgi:hypothetical protein